MSTLDRDGEYRPGDRVRRRIDGLEMTVVEVYTPFYVYRYKCSWGPDAQTQSDLFRLEEIEPLEAE